MFSHVLIYNAKCLRLPDAAVVITHPGTYTTASSLMRRICSRIKMARASNSYLICCMKEFVL